ncbi:glycosyltransferase involved in cell wall biosynthesis [Paenibacillus castaneae]|uniref:glycosyltransferase n=1 Tax=Paenibacillus castaneae TaxID=474957 RepID=UPI000C9B9A02|nr:glycosyltransferase [Paenibacillus castaneae]NIK79063.1 glycosyltransferase involved in cell wall biosynthesis [Paenibacillus castaneae]
MHDNRPKVSIIVPVYNSDQYLACCLQSIITQTLNEIEIIVVNDGSTDHSAQIIDEFAAKFTDKMIVITKTNGGLGDARNHGIRVATGEYIGFVDSDDWVTPDMFEQLYNLAAQGHDLVVCDVIETNPKSEKSYLTKGFRGRNFSQKEIVIYATDPAYACNKLFKRTLFEQVEFPSVWYEDVATIPIILSYVQNPAYLEIPLYFYRKHSASITHSNDPKSLGVLTAWDRLLTHMNPAFKPEAVFSVARSIHIFMDFKPKFANSIMAYAQKHRKIIESNVYYQQALKRKEIRDFFGTNQPSGQAKLRIYFYSSQISGRGGMETVLTTVANSLLNKGHDVKIILSEHPTFKDWETNGVNVIYTSSVRKDADETLFQRNKNKGNIILLRRLLRNLPRADFIVALDTKDVATAKFAVEGFDSRPLIASWVHFNMKAIRAKQNFLLANFHIAINKELQDDIISLTSNTNTYLLYNPVSLNKEKIQRPKDTKFLYVGRLFNYQKRVDRILDALSKVDGNWTLQIIGDGLDEPMLRDLAKELGIEDRISWEGWKPDPWAYVNEATCLIMASAYEGFGLSAAEALARGIPVVAGDCSGLKELIKNGENGWLFPFQDLSALSDILNSVVKGTLPLPDQDRVQASVEPFNEYSIIERLEQIFLEMQTKRSKIKRMRLMSKDIRPVSSKKSKNRKQLSLSTRKTKKGSATALKKRY